jgi:hypothetical protein
MLFKLIVSTLIGEGIEFDRPGSTLFKSHGHICFYEKHRKDKPAKAAMDGCVKLIE